MKRRIAVLAVITGALALPLAGSTASAGDAPEILTTSLPDGHVGMPYSYKLEATGGVVTDYYWNICDGWSPPENMNLYPDGTLAGTPLETQYGITLYICARVKIQSGQIWTDKILPLEIDVDDGAPPNPVIESTTLPPGESARYYSFQMVASGGDRRGYVWLLCPGWVLPEGLTLSSGGLLSGTPPSSTDPVYDICLRVISGGSTGRILSLSISRPDPRTWAVTLTPDSVVPAERVIGPGDSVKFRNRSGGYRTILRANGSVVASLQPGTGATVRLRAIRLHRFVVKQTGQVILIRVV